jgi:pimeloyl-ACP methyl ester carboxylesterase
MKQWWSFFLFIVLSSCMSIPQQNQVIFDPKPLAVTHAFALPPQTREVFIPVAVGIQLNALYYQQPGASRGLLLYFPGNAHNLQSWLDTHAPAVLHWGFDVLVADYRGFGKSEGQPSGQPQLYADAEQVYHYALRLGYQPKQVVLYGYSMGGASATYLATAHAARALVLESAYSSINEIPLFKDKAPAYALNNSEQARHIDVPTLMLHGTADQDITPDHAQRVYANLRTPRKQLVLIEGGGHGNLRQRPEYLGLLDAFLQTTASGAY